MYSSNASYSSSRSTGRNSLTAKEIQNMMMDEDDSSTSTSTSTISSDEDADFENEDDMSIGSSDSENEVFVDRIEAFAIQGNTPALAQLVFSSDIRLFSKKNKRTSNSSVASLRSTTSLVNYKAPPTNEDANLLTADEIAKMLIMSRPVPGKQRVSSDSTSAGMRRSVSESRIHKSYDTVGPSISDDNASILSKKSSVSGKQTIPNDMKPWDYLGVLMTECGIKHEAVPYTKVPDGFFTRLESKHFTSYDSDIARATRVGDLAAVQARYGSKRPLLSCNRFKETTIHTICRRGHVNLLRFIVNETDISIRVVDDIGRNPIHDACWTHRPNFELMKMLVTACPDLLYISDNRGFTPLDYVGKGCWREWCKFLRDNKDIIVPKEVLG